MNVEIKKNQTFPDCYDLFVNSKLEIEAESFTIVDQVKENLESAIVSTSECGEVADSIRNGEFGCKNCLLAGAECINGNRRMIATDGKCNAYIYCD
jgi:hypothetical protein